MTKYVTTDGSGLPTGFYDSAISGSIPGGAHAVTNAQYDALIAAPTTTTFISGTIGSTTAAPFTPNATQTALTALKTGMVITCTGNSASSATYGLDTTTMALMGDLVALINANSGAYPGAVGTWSWPDAGGTLRPIPTAARFLALWKALSTYRLALFGIVWAGTGSPPSASATIA